MPNSYPRVFQADQGDKIYRRSLYTFWKRGLPPPQMTIFDAPTRESCIARRERTNTPLQALVLMNEEQYFNAARHLAKSLLTHKPALTKKEILQRAYELITSQSPDESTARELEKALHDFREIYTNHPAETAEMLDGNNDVNLAAWTMLVHSLFNLDEVKTRE